MSGMRGLYGVSMPSIAALVGIWVTILTALAMPSEAAAHPLAPLALTIKQNGEAVTATIKRSRVQPRGAVFTPRFPSTCEAIAPMTVADNDSFATERYELRCDGSLVGAKFGIDGLSEANLDAVVSVTLDGGHVIRPGLLDASDNDYIVPAATRSTALDLATSFGGSGLLHLLGGLDHLLFVVGVVLLLQRPRRVLMALTAFTVGHGLSMCAATLGWVEIPSRVAETAIAATLIWLAWEIVRRTRDHEQNLKRPYLAAVGVGLIHGLGFASAFSAMGVTGSNLSIALIAFHTGIELAQVAVVVVALTALRVSSRRRGTLELALGYAIGSLAFMWLVERALIA